MEPRGVCVCVCVLLLCMCVSMSVVPVRGATYSEVVVQLDSGTIEGMITNDGLARAFRGIPYAAPPVGDRRWTSPSPPKNWTGIRTAYNDAPGCIQICQLPAHTCPPTTSEDCLYLNVFTPRLGSYSTPPPTMVFLHGGNFFQGYGGGPLYDGRFMANYTGTILVSLNYRLAALGFLGNKGTLKGNYGIQDQRMALQWVQHNIAAFGGDPSQVTLFGQSAGSQSVAIHMYSPASAGLFQKALMESNPWALPLRTEDDMYGLAVAFSLAIGCSVDDVVCLRSKSAEEVRTATNKTMTDIFADLKKVLQMFEPYTPIVGTVDVPKQPLQAVVDGDVRAMPVLLGNTRNEAVLFIHEAFPAPLPAWEYDIIVTAIFSLKYTFPVLKQYPGSGADTRPVASTLTTHSLFLCANRNVSRLLSARMPTFYYIFDHPFSNGSQIWGDESFCYNVSCHGEDLPFVFDSITGRFANFTSDEKVLAKSMLHMWTSFARNGNPNGYHQQPTWPGYISSTSLNMHFQTPVNKIDSFFLDQTCAFWDEIGYVWE